MTALILAVLSCLIITQYLVIYVIYCGIPTSLSATYKRNECRWLFPTTVGISSFLLAYPLILCTPHEYEFLAYISIFSAALIVESPLFKPHLVDRIHCVSAVLIGASVLTWILLVADLPLIALLGIGIGMLQRKNFTFWFEVGMLYDLYFRVFQILAVA